MTVEGSIPSKDAEHQKYLLEYVKYGIATTPEEARLLTMSRVVGMTVNLCDDVSCKSPYAGPGAVPMNVATYDRTIKFRKDPRRTHHDWTRLCPACGYADGRAHYIATKTSDEIARERYGDPEDVPSALNGQPLYSYGTYLGQFYQDIYDQVYVEIVQEDEYYQQLKEEQQAHAVKVAKESIRHPLFVDTSVPERVWHWKLPEETSLPFGE